MSEPTPLFWEALTELLLKKRTWRPTIDLDTDTWLCRNCGGKVDDHEFRCDTCDRLLPVGTCGCGSCRMPTDLCHDSTSTCCVTTKWESG